MADKITNLYNALVKSGYNMASEEVFRERMNDPSKRKAAYDAMVKSGYNMRPYEEFEANIGYAPKPQASPTPAPAPQAEPEAPKPAQTWKPSEQDKIRMSYQLNTMLNDFKKSQERGLSRRAE